MKLTVKSKEQILVEAQRRKEETVRGTIRKGVRVRGDHGAFNVDAAQREILAQIYSRKQVIHHKKVEDILLFNRGGHEEKQKE